MLVVKESWPLCISPWGKAVFTNLVAQGAETDAEHLCGDSAISVGESESLFEMKPFDLPDRSACRCEGRSRCVNSWGLHCWNMGGARETGAVLKFHLETAGIEIVCLAQGEDTAHEICQFADIAGPGL